MSLCILLPTNASCCCSTATAASTCFSDGITLPSNTQKSTQCRVLAQTIDIPVRHFLRHCSAGEVIRVYRYDVQGRFGQVVEQANYLIVRLGIADHRVEDAGANVWLDHPIYFRLGNRQIGLLMCTRPVRFSKHLKQVSQEINVAQIIKLYIILRIFTLNNCKHVLCVSIVDLHTVHVSKLVEKVAR